MNYIKIRERERQFLSVTGLYVDEFDHLLPTFLGIWRNYYRIHTIEGKKRKEPLINALADTRSLPSVEEKLFFILVYLKNYSLQEMTGASFNFSQSQTSKWQKVLRPLLHKTLDKLGMLPLRDSELVAARLEGLGVKNCFQDVSERLVQRSVDQDVQEEFYSAKKKTT
jgi:hypothetical protein